MDKSDYAIIVMGMGAVVAVLWFIMQKPQPVDASVNIIDIT